VTVFMTRVELSRWTPGRVARRSSYSLVSAEQTRRKGPDASGLGDLAAAPVPDTNLLLLRGKEPVLIKAGVRRANRALPAARLVRYIEAVMMRQLLLRCRSEV